MPAILETPPAGPLPRPDDRRAVEVSVDLRRGAEQSRRLDLVAREEPMEIRVGGVPLGVLMRTPGHDEELALGFLVTEGVVARAADVVSVRHCSTVEEPASEDNVVQVVLADGVAVDLAALRRHFYAGSSCGLCGKATIENAMRAAPPLRDDAVFDPALLVELPSRLLAAQDLFHATGGLHAAALFDGGGRLLAVREDVGRHNAVDKVVGWALGEGLVPLSGHVLLVSGRVSWEIVQKAMAARLPLVAGISAPTSLAVEMAEAAGIALVGFLRGEAMNVYAGSARLGFGAAGGVERGEAAGEDGR